jgi:polyhydroxyalkanoate synthesis regulator phasin
MKTSNKERVIYNGSDNTKTDFAIELQKRLLVKIKATKGEKKNRTVWDTINKEYVQDISCVVTDIVFETLSYNTFGKNSKYYEEMLNIMVDSIVNRGTISEELSTSLFDELVATGVSAGIGYVGYKIENIEKHKEYVSNMTHLGRWQLGAIRSISQIIEGQLHNVASKRSKGLFPSKNLRKQLDDEMLKEVATTVRDVVTQQHLIESLFFSLSPKRIERSLGENIVFDTNDMQTSLQNITTRSKKLLFNDFDSQIRDFNNVADKSFLKKAGNISLKYKAAIGVMFVVGALVITGLGSLVISFVLNVGQNFLLPLGGAAIAGGLVLALGDAGFTIKTTIENYWHKNLKKQHDEFKQEIKEIAKPNMSDAIILDNNIIAGLNPLLKKEETEDVCMKFTEKYQQFTRKEDNQRLTEQEKYKFVDDMFSLTN